MAFLKGLDGILDRCRSADLSHSDARPRGNLGVCRLACDLRVDHDGVPWARARRKGDDHTRWCRTWGHLTTSHMAAAKMMLICCMVLTRVKRTQDPSSLACDSITTCHGDEQHTGVHFTALAFLFSAFSKRASASWPSGYMGSASGLF